ncbi:OmpA family protein [Neolewinella antarctica]|uniref:Outer membrane protein OmpA-like peptidoglycan-associated protein/tetratricopeptide (TPR) repeat protein n=1 Tax=Neolewinella antarctica TaxID=442734 RepID=A0ABX0X6H0_9BACT|nr:OmpA family protein [Neolewinella antarctica]NJC24589.1 outer membrane protein OmpA-like peptidoglycan-associated protein/tetratricopeptide (TPR) repeat protein [Neolewinella antarctica]
MRFTWLLSLLVLLSACTYTAKITDGNTAVERKQYDVAVPMLRREFKKAKSRKDKGELALNLGVSLRETAHDEEAADWFQQAYDNNAGPDALREKAAALKRLERYEDAIQVYTDLGFEIGSKYEFRKDIEGAELAMKWRDQEAAGKQREFTVQPASFNSKQSEYGPVYFEDRLIFSSDRQGGTSSEDYKWTGRGFTDLYATAITGGSVTPFDAQLNTADHEGTPAFSDNGKEMYFTRCFAPGKREDAFCGLYVSERTGDSWSAAKKVSFVKSGINYLHPALSANGQQLYFSALMEDGWGGYDIYVANRKVDGTWNDPILMNRAINTQGNEQFPSLDADTLYFASDGLVGMGGLDIFRTHPLANGRYSAPKNLGTPLNSGADDFGYTIVKRMGTGQNEKTLGFFSTARPGGSGADDIYEYSKRVLPPPPIDSTPIAYKNILDVTVVEKIYEDASNPSSNVRGLRPVPNTTIIARIGDQSRTVTTNEDGQLSLVLVDDQAYDFRAEREDYLAAEGNFSSRNLPRDPDAPDQRYELELEIEKIFANQEIVLENIYYDFNESFIRSDAQPTLNELSSLLDRNPTIKIELGSHTDCRGRDAYNQDLSQDRAQSAVTYLIESGIDATRLTARGYGETQPVAECICERCSEEEHQRNRRTTFRILE